MTQREGRGGGDGRVPLTQEDIDEGAPSRRSAGRRARRRTETPAALGPLLRFLKLFADLVTPTNVVLLVGVAIVGVTGLLGGWTAIEERPDVVPELATGEAAQTGPFAITVERALWDPDPSEFGLPDTGDALLVVRAQVENTHGSWIDATVLASALTGRLPGVALVPQSGLYANSLTTDGSIGTPTLRRAVDLQYAATVQPAPAQAYWFVWELPADTPRTDRVDLEFNSQNWRASALDGHHLWTDRALLARQTVDVETDGRTS